MPPVVLPGTPATHRTVPTRRRLRGSSVGGGLSLVLVCAGAMLVMSGTADARSRGKAKSCPSAAPALDAQAVNGARLLGAVRQKTRQCCQRGHDHKGGHSARPRRLLARPDRRQERAQRSKGYRRVSRRKRDQAKRSPRPANLGALDRDVERSGAHRSTRFSRSPT